MKGVPKGKVNQIKLYNVYHTSLFEETPLTGIGPGADEKILVAMDVNTDSQGLARFICYQAVDPLNGGGVLVSIPYIKEHIVNPDEMRAKAVDYCNFLGITYTDDQLDKIFAQDGYLEPEKIKQVSGEDLNRERIERFKNAAPEDLHERILKVMQNALGKMSVKDMIDALKNSETQEVLIDCMEKALVENRNDALAQPLIYANVHEAAKLKEEGVKAQASFLLANHVDPDEILALISEPAEAITPGCC